MIKRDCELCQSYGCKVFGAYVLLCLVAIIAYSLLVPALTENGKGPDKAVLIIGLMAWTAAMIVPVAAYYAITDWREQQKAQNYSELVSSLLMVYKQVSLSQKELHKNIMELWNNTVNYASADNIALLYTSNNLFADKCGKEINKFHSYSLKHLKDELTFFDTVLPNENLMSDIRKFFENLESYFNTAVAEIINVQFNEYTAKNVELFSEVREQAFQYTQDVSKEFDLFEKQYLKYYLEFFDYKAK